MTGSEIALEARGLTVGYEGRNIFTDLDLRVDAGSITTLIGANGCGKSTLLRTFGRLLKPSAGTLEMNGTPLHARSTKQVARELAFLPQKPITPVSTSVRELVSRGRHPHRSLWEMRPGTDAHVTEALEATALTEIAEADAGSLSGGQLQRAWIALVLAQDTGIVLLDEPTTYLDLSKQLDVLRIVRKMNRERGVTVLMVLHDLNLAARFSDRLVAVGGGRILADGNPGDVLVPDVLREAFELEAQVVLDPQTGTPLVVPMAEA